MSKPLILEIDFLLTTPAFLGDARMMAALRPQSFKGLLRHWHRAIDCTLTGSDKKREDRIWGGSEKDFGQSKVLLRIQSKGKPAAKWKYDSKKFSRFQKGSGIDALNGITYLGYPFGMGDNKKRDALAPFTQFTLQGVIPAASRLKEDDIKGIIASFWLLAVLGTCGSRSRRGFGSLLPTGWRLQNKNTKTYPDWEKFFGELPPPGRANSGESWQKALDTALTIFRKWFGSFSPETAHAHMGQNFNTVLMEGHNSWETAMAAGGAEMQQFRRGRKPDIDTIYEFIKQPENNITAPERASFGLPLSFRFKGIKGDVKFIPARPHPNADSPDRFTSLLCLKIIRLGTRFHPLYFLLDGLEPAMELSTLAKFKNKTYTTRRPAQSAMRIFFKELQEKAI